MRTGNLLPAPGTSATFATSAFNSTSASATGDTIAGCFALTVGNSFSPTAVSTYIGRSLTIVITTEFGVTVPKGISLLSWLPLRSTAR